MTVQSWNGGFVATVKVAAGSSAISGWDVTLNLGGASITSGWNGTFSGNHVTNMSYNGSVGAGASTEFGFQGTGSSSGLSVAGCSAR
jgi:endo-1,4-beta-xylanase